MYNKQKMHSKGLKVNKTYQGEWIEQKVNRVTNNKEPITDGAAIVYTERRDGVKPEYNIKTDKWEVALEAMDAVANAHRETRAERIIGKIEEQNKDGQGQVNTSDGQGKE